MRKANMTKEQKERARARARINRRNNRGVNYWVKQALKSR